MNNNDFKDYHSDGIQEYQNYFGTPTYDDHLLFELLTVGVFQVGLSWQTAASKIPIYRRDFNGMVISQVAALDLEFDVERIAKDPDMISNPRKIGATITNARAILKLYDEFGSFSNYIWQFTAGSPLVFKYATKQDVPRELPIGNRVATDMKKRGFKFVGPVVTYMFLKAAGVIRDEIMPERL